MTKKQASLELIFAGALWGFGFVASIWALQAFTPVETVVFRFVVATVLGEFIYLLVRGFHFSASLKKEFLRALPAGILLGGMLLLQVIGLQYTSATKSGFITCLYVILVPLFNSWFFRQKSTWINYILAFLALLGTFVLMDGNLQDLNIGDLWTLACAVVATFQIIYIGRISNKVTNAFRFNNMQSFWCLVVIAPLLLTQKSVTILTTNWLAWTGIFSLGIASSIIALYLQIRTQKVLPDSTASMLFLLESPFAALFGFILLDERLSWFQMMGALLILSASFLQILFDPAKTTEKTSQ